MGLMNAYTLIRKGHSVCLYDPEGFPPKTSASYIAGGMLAPYSEIDLMGEDCVSSSLMSIDIWREIASDLGIEDAFSQTGSLLIAHREDMHLLDRFAAHLPPEDNWQQVKGHDIRVLEPMLPASFQAGLSLPDEASIHPQRAMTALCGFLKNHPQCDYQQKVTDPHLLEDDYDFVIDCRGMGAAWEDRQLRGVKGEIAVVHNPGFTLHRVVRLMHPRYPLYIVPRAGNIFMIGATQIESSENESISVRSGLELLSALYSLHPSFGDAQILELQAGIRPAYADNLPRIETERNIISCNGLFRHGYLLSPVMAQTVSEMIEQKNNLTAPFLMREAA